MPSSTAHFDDLLQIGEVHRRFRRALRHLHCRSTDGFTRLKGQGRHTSELAKHANAPIVSSSNALLACWRRSFSSSSTLVFRKCLSGFASTGRLMASMCPIEARQSAESRSCEVVSSSEAQLCEVGVPAVSLGICQVL